MSALPDELTIGELAIRSGVATSALRFYEALGLIGSRRTPGNQRRYPRAVLRQVAVIRAAQVLGLSLSEIQQALAALPDSRTPTKQDWARLSQTWRARLEARIQALERLRVDLTGCIGCGCLSLDSCALFNRNDEAASQGVDGSRLITDYLDGRKQDQAHRRQRQGIHRLKSQRAATRGLPGVDGSV